METARVSVDAIIIAGGKGSRMEHELPKPLIPVRGRALIEYQIDYLLSQKSINRIIFSLGVAADRIQSHIQTRYRHDRCVSVIEDHPLGTAGGLRKALAAATTPMVIALNCDDILDLDVDAFARVTEHTICVAHPRLPFGRVREQDGYAIFEEKPLLADWTSCGWYCFDKEQLLPMLPEEGSLEYDVFPKIRMRMFYHEGMWWTMNTRKDIEAFEKGEEAGK